MLDKNDKDQIICFLRDRLKEIDRIAKEHDENSSMFCNYETNGYEMIEDLIERTLLDTTW